MGYNNEMLCRSTNMNLEDIEREREMSGWNQYVGEVKSWSTMPETHRKYGRRKRKENGKESRTEVQECQWRSRTDRDMQNSWMQK